MKEAETTADCIIFAERIHGCTVLGPYKRSVIWVSGCCFDCEGCIAQNFRHKEGTVTTVEEMGDWLIGATGEEGITVSGGEPFLQAGPLAQMISNVREEKDIGVIVYSGYTYQQLLEKGDILKLQRQYNELRKRADAVLTESATELIKYYDRLAALDVIADAMKEQNYKIDWALPEGDDPTQKMVVHFTNRVSGNTVSVTLDQDMDSADIKRLAMDILFYYERGDYVSEVEKGRVRKFLNDKLTEAGLTADVDHCKGAVNKPSSKTEYSQEKNVIEKQPRRLFKK